MSFLAPAAEARKAGGASETALRIPKPQNLTGNDASVHADGETSTLINCGNEFLNRSSYRSSSGLSKQGALQSMYM